MASYSFCGFTNSSHSETLYHGNTDEQLQLTALCCSTCSRWQKPTDTYIHQQGASEAAERWVLQLVHFKFKVSTIEKNYGFNSANSSNMFWQDATLIPRRTTVQFTCSDGVTVRRTLGNFFIIRTSIIIIIILTWGWNQQCGSLTAGSIFGTCSFKVVVPVVPQQWHLREPSSFILTLMLRSPLDHRNKLICLILTCQL